MNRVFSAFYNKKNAQPGSYRFMFDGERLEDNDTAETKDMDDNCVVYVQLEKTGGRLVKLIFENKKRTKCEIDVFLMMGKEKTVSDDSKE